MIALMALAAVSQAADYPTIYVSLPPGREAAMVHAWHDRSFSESVNVELSDQNASKLRDMEAVRSRLMPHVIVADWSDWDLRTKHRIPEATDKAGYRVGRYGTWESFPTAAWRYPELSLLYLDWIARTWDMQDEIEAWDTQYHLARMETARLWVARYFPRDFNYYWGYAYIKDYYGYYDKPELPVVARRPHPIDLIPNPLRSWR